jgi:hypothetical protein
MAVERAFDPETLRLLQDVLEQAAAAFPPGALTQEQKSLLASRILALAASGETDPVRLRTALILHIAPRAGDNDKNVAAE